MADEQELVRVAVVFVDGSEFKCAMTTAERDRFHKAFVTFLNSKDPMVRGGTFEALDGNHAHTVSFDYRTIKYVC